MFLRLISALALALYLALAAVAAEPGIFTVQIGGGSTQVAPTPLVRHGDEWHYRKGTNAPQSDWKTASSNLLDASWLAGPGGFGYEDGDDATVLNTMSNGFTTVYIRRQFDLPSTPGTNERLRLIMDWDDGFVAWLNGNEIARSPNAPGAAGTEPAHNAVSLAPNHEASAGPGGNPPTVYDLGPAADRLEPGTQILAVMGLNGAINSSDFSLIADLETLDTSVPPAPSAGPHYTLVSANPIVLSGTNTLPGAARVFIDGRQATFSVAEGRWYRSHFLNPGMNRLFIASLDSDGNILAGVNRDVVYESSTVFAGGTLPANTTWASGVVRVTNSLIVPSGRTLSIGPGVVVLLSPTASITATGIVTVTGTEANPVFFLPASGSAWGSLVASGGGSITVRHAEIVGGQVRPINGGSTIIEDSVVRDLPDPARELFAGVNGANMTVRRSLITRFTEVDARDTPVLIEDCLLQDFLVDGVDIKTTTGAPLIVRNSTLRFGNPANSNADAIDFGPGAGTVERCLIHHFPDKGVSIGGAPGTRVHGSVIYNCGIGISADAATGVVLDNNTVADCQDGLFIRNNSSANGTNLIVWGSARANIIVSNASTLAVRYSDVQGGFAGTGNISADPLFVDAAARDYRLSSASPARGSGFGGADMGAIFPVGGIPDVPEMLAAHEANPGSIRLSWQEDSDNEDSFIVQTSPDANTWADVGLVSANSTEYFHSGLQPGIRYYYRVAATNASGKSRYSNIASATPTAAPASETFVGGTLTTHTTWSADMGMIIVRSNVIVSTNVVLTIEAGANIKLTNGVAIRAVAGGVINVLGTESNKVTISRWNPVNAQRELSANGTNASLYIRHADISGCQTTVYNGATGFIEDSKCHDYRISGGTTFTQPIVLSQFAKLMTVRRCHVSTYYETLFRNGVIIIEDSLFEDISGDGLDFDAAQVGTVLRRCTFRNGTLGNVDAVDVGPAELGGSRDVIIEDCLMYNFPFDKGVSVGDAPSQATGTIVRNCLIYGCLSGVQAKDECIVTVYNCTIANNAWGFTNYNKANPAATNGGGHTVAWNNILWNNNITISMWDTGTLVANYNDLGNTNWPGTGNINADPLFLDVAARDYRLSPGSPCIGTGSNGVTMGVTFPVGGIPAEPLNLVIVTNYGPELLLAWNDNSGNESGFVIEVSTNGVNWSALATAPANSSNALATTSAGIHFRARATNFIGASFASNVATLTGPPGDLDGDGMPDSWEETYQFNRADWTDAGDDADDDGQSNLNEYRSGTDPRNASSRLGFDSIVRTGPDGIRLTFTAQAGKAYRIEYRDSLSSGPWESVGVPAEGTTRAYTFDDTLDGQARFYRLIIP
jgi:hypothetical protein